MIIGFAYEVQPTGFGYAARCAEALRASADWHNEFGAGPKTWA